MEESGGVKMPYEVADHEWDERCYEYRVRKIGIGSIPAEVVVEVQHWAEFVDECYDAFDVMKMDRGGIVGMIADRSTAMFMPYYFKDDETLLGMVAFAVQLLPRGQGPPVRRSFPWASECSSHPTWTWSGSATPRS